jgi:hypothetical protein
MQCLELKKEFQGGTLLHALAFDVLKANDTQYKELMAQEIQFKTIEGGINSVDISDEAKSHLMGLMTRKAPDTASGKIFEFPGFVGEPTPPTPPEPPSPPSPSHIITLHVEWSAKYKKGMVSEKRSQKEIYITNADNTNPLFSFLFSTPSLKLRTSTLRSKRRSTPSSKRRNLSTTKF